MDILDLRRYAQAYALVRGAREGDDVPPWAQNAVFEVEEALMAREYAEQQQQMDGTDEEPW